MAGSGTIGALRVVLGIDTAVFDKDAAQVSSKMAGLGASMKKAGAIIATGLAAAVTGLAASVKHVADEADELSKTAQKIGVPIEQLSKLKYAADLSDVSLGDLTTSMGKLSKNMAAVATGGGADAAKAFEALGISVKNSDGTLKSSSTVFSDIAAKFAGMKDGATKTALAMMLFGRSGADLIPLLNSGATGLKEMGDEAAALGLVIDQKTGTAAEAFNDNLTRLGAIGNGIVIQLTAGMLPAFEHLSAALVDSAKNSDTMKSVTSALSKVMDGLTRAIVFVFDNLGTLVKVAEVFIAARIAAAAIQMATAFLNFAKAIRITAIVMQVFEGIRKLSYVGILLMVGAVALAIGQFDNLSAALSSLKNKIAASLPDSIPQAFIDQLRAVGFDVKALEMNLGTLSTTNDGTSKTTNDLALAMGGSGSAAKKAAADTKTLTDANSALMDEGKSVTEGLRTPAEELSATIAHLNDLVNAGAITWETYSRGITKAQDDFTQAGQQLGDVGQAVHQSLSSAFDGFIEGTFNARRAITDLLKDLIKLELNKAFASLIGKAGDFIGTALSGGSGPTSIIPPGFATGGSFKVGGAAGTDKNFVPIRATRGEYVSVSHNDPGAGSGGSANVSVQIINNAGANVSTQSQDGPDGPSIQVMVDKATAQNMTRQGSSTNKALTGGFGARPTPNRR